MLHFPRERFLELFSIGARTSPLNISGLVRQCGVFMEPLPSPGQRLEYEVVDFPFCVAWRTCRTKAGQRQGLVYAEGFASIEGLPVPKAHAWCVTPEGAVLDPSWTHGQHYFGFVIRQQFAEPFMAEIDYGMIGMHAASPLLSNPVETWMVPHPLLSERKAS